MPVADGSTVDLVVETEQATSIESVNTAVKTASEGSLSRIVEFVDDPIVSSDVRDATHSAVFDSLATMVLGDTMVKTITWFNNGWGYSSRVVEVAERLAAARSNIMTTRVAINGFGRIGRNVFRIILERASEAVEVVAINDLADDDILAYLLEYDSVMGPLGDDAEVTDGVMRIGSHAVSMLMERDPAALPWAELDVDIVIEATGVFRDRDSLQKHLDAGAKRVILTVPPKGEVDEMVVLGVNDELLTDDDLVVSNASCTTNCLAPLAKVLDDAFGIERGLMTTVHAYTNDQRLADVPHADLRRSRAATENIIPTTTGAAAAVGKVLPRSGWQTRWHGDAGSSTGRLDGRSGA